MKNIMILENDRHTMGAVSTIVEMAWPGCNIRVATSSRQILPMLLAEIAEPDVIILDMVALTLEIMTVCRAVRKVSQVPIVGLSASNGTDVKKTAYDCGITEILQKPINEFALFVRLRDLAHERDGDGADSDGYEHKTCDISPARIDAGNIRLEMDTRQVFVGNKWVRLTSTEYRLLAELVQNRGLVISNEKLLERVWGPEYTDSPQYLKVFVHRLRRKMGCRNNGAHYIQNEWGKGYRFVPMMP